MKPYKVCAHKQNRYVNGRGGGGGGGGGSGGGCAYTPVISEQGRGDSDEGEDEVEGEEVPGNNGASQLHTAEQGNGECNDQGLPSLHSIDTSKDVDGIAAEHCQHPHVHIIE